jgi:hypothetical protein
MKNYIKNIFFRNTHIAPLVTFRIVFGVLMVIGTIRFMALGWIEDHYSNPLFHFKYYGFSWVEPLNLFGLYAVHILLIIASLFVALGLFYRLSAILVFVLFTYIELIDLTYYLNHYYFVSLASFLLILVPANRFLSLDVWRKPSLYRNYVPTWCINIFKIQIAIVYIFAGLMKLNYDWLLNALPLKIWLPANNALPIIGHLFTYEAIPYFFSWVGMLFDTTIIFWMMNRITRPFAYITIIVFHVLTGVLFQIGVFPLVMIGATLIFFSNDWHNNKFRLLGNYMMPNQLSFINQYRVIKFSIKKSHTNFIALGLTLFIIFQLIFPWRFILYPNNMFWTEQGYRFGWRVMLMEKAGTATFYVTDTKSGKEGEVFNTDFLNAHQEKQMAMQPDMILQYAHFLGKHYAQQGIYKPKVRAEVYVTLNAKPSRLFIDSTIDLMKVQDGWYHKDWIKDFNEKNVR